MENKFILDSDVIFDQKIKDGSLIKIGKNRQISITTDRRFNWFQKKMIRWCFGFEVVNYKEKQLAIFTFSLMR